MCICQLYAHNNFKNILHIRVVRKSSYRLNLLILIAVLVGFVGTLLHVIKLDDNMSEVVTTTICNVS